MYLKNNLVPLKLSMSLFHPLHVASLHSAATLIRPMKELLSGAIEPGEAFARTAKALTIVPDLMNDSKQGWKTFNVWKGKVAEKDLTSADRLAQQYILEGGFIPAISREYQTGALKQFKQAIKEHSLTTPLKLLPALIDAMQKPVFEMWIPSLKTASYLKDVETALKSDPSLLTDNGRRIDMFRQLSKSVDNRYGEMAYSTLFWNRAIKDAAVGSTLSLGWNLGFLREYGGALTDTGQALINGDLKGAAKKGQLDKAMFVAAYTTQALIVGGLITKGLGGSNPQSLLDLTMPRVGGTGPDGKPARVSTMFYAAEMEKIAKHMESEGVVNGLATLIANKASPILSTVKDVWTGINYMGQEIRDPNAPAYKQLEQTVAYVLKDSLPITYSNHGEGVKGRALSFLGFSPAPKYVTESPIEAKINSTYYRYHDSVKPYEQMVNGPEGAKLRELYLQRDEEGFEKQIDKMEDMYEEKHGKPMSETQKKNLRKSASVASVFKHFKALSVTDQKRFLDSMAPEERESYLPYVRKELRGDYE
jgi:hypothetical protein